MCVYPVLVLEGKIARMHFETTSMTGAKAAGTVGEITGSTGDVGEGKGRQIRAKGLRFFTSAPPTPRPLTSKGR